jgi:hypothetical protein
VEYRDVEKSNHVQIALNSGSTLTGTVLKTEPHQIILLIKDQQPIPVQKSAIRSIKRIPMVLDDFGNGISEEEIQKNKTHRNAKIYGIGGGVLSFGISFFIGSMIGNASDNGGTVMAASTAAGTLLGTALFINAGKNKDQKTAIEKIRENRQTAEILPGEPKKTPLDMKQILEDEKKKQEELRKEREELLKQLQQSPNNP